MLASEWRLILIKQYFNSINEILEKVLTTQYDVMEEAAEIITQAIIDRRNIFVFGSGHAGILAQELFYRTGGLAVINPILAAGLTLDVRPIDVTTEVERLDGYAKIILDSTPIDSGDVLIIHSVSGRNIVPVEMAIYARQKDITVIGLTNMEYSTQITSRHQSGKRLFEVCDLYIDNCGSFGDSEIDIEGFENRIAPSSTAIGATILNSIMAQVVQNLVNHNIVPPVYLSANVDGGDEHNRNILELYSENIFYSKKGGANIC